MSTVDELLNSATNMFGRLKGDTQQRLRAVLVSPTLATWDDAYTLVVDGVRMRSLWQLVCDVDHRCPDRLDYTPDVKDRWHGYVPSSFTIRQALELLAED